MSEVKKQVRLIDGFKKVFLADLMGWTRTKVATAIKYHQEEEDRREIAKRLGMSYEQLFEPSSL